MNAKAQDHPLTLDHNHPNAVEIDQPEAETVIVEIEYIESKDLNNIAQVDAVLKSLVTDLDSKDWVLVCDALYTVRRLSIFHKEEMMPMLRVIFHTGSLTGTSDSAQENYSCRTEEEHPAAATWQIFCQSILSPLSAQAVLRVTNVAGVAREGLVTGS